MLKEKVANNDEDMLLLQVKIISFYANNSELKLYKNRFELEI